MQLHIELTSACNSGCLDCNRFIKKTDILNPSVSIEWFTLDMIKNVLDDVMVNKIKNINFTGTYGESSLHPQFFEFLDIISERIPHKVKIMMETNGGTRDTVWWEKFGKIIKEKFREDSFVVFSLDGIDDETHQKYRRGVKFEKVINNAKAFSKHSTVIWQMIEFEHNKHQFDKAKEGYVNLLPVQHKKSKNPGDDAQMVQALHLSQQHKTLQNLFIDSGF